MKNESYAARLERGFDVQPDGDRRRNDTVNFVAGEIMLQSQVDAVREMAKERDALVADAARYRWLRNSCSWEAAIWEAVEMATGADLGQSLGQALDDSVNAARAVQP